MTSDKKNSKGKTKSVKKVTKNAKEKPDWYYKKEKWEPSEIEITKFMKTLRSSSGKKLMRYVIFENLRKKKWFCRDCGAEQLSKSKLQSGQYAGGGGIQGLERGGGSRRPGCELESGSEQCEKHGSTAHDRWTGYFKPSFSQGSVPAKLQEKIFVMRGYKDVLEERTREAGGLMIDHKFPRGEFNVNDDIPYKEIFDNLQSDDPKKVTEGKKQCGQYFQILKKDQVGNHNKMKTEFCGTCCKCHACEKELSDHTEEELEICYEKPATNPEKRYGKRGLVMGINFFYKGDENWPKGVPRRGKEAEKGCEGCGWYDVEKWKEKLNEILVSK